MTESKPSLRKRLQPLRRDMSEPDRLDASAKIADRVMCLEEVEAANRVACYVSMADEVQTDDILERLIGRDGSVMVPVWDPELAAWFFGRIHTLEDLQPGAFRVREPIRFEAVSADQVEVVLLPGLGFDREGNRLGRGRGHIDQWLAGLGLIRIGLAFDFQVVPRVPCETHDLPMHVLVTEKGAMYCR